MKKLISLLAVLTLLSVMLLGCASKEYTLTVQVQGQGQVTKSPDQELYSANSKVDLEAIPSDGWAFDHWEGSLQGTTNPTTITVNSNQQVNAVFTENNSSDLSNIWLSLDLIPFRGYSAEHPSYRVVFMINRKGDNVDPNEFHDTIITINNTPLELSIFNGDDFQFDGTIDLASGDLVQVKIEHTAFGTIEQTLTVPEVVASLSTDPADLDSWTSGAVENVTLSWPELDCDGYRYQVNMYDALGEMIGSHSNTTENTSKVLDQSWLLNWSDEKATYAALEVYSINEVSFDNFYGNSGIEISAPTSPAVSNVPN